MATPFQFDLVTPERVLFSGEVEDVSLRTDEGEITFLAGHEDFVGAVDISVCSFHDHGEGSDPTLVAVHGGFVHVAEGKATVLVGVAELGSEIDVARARAALDSTSSQTSSEPDASREELESAGVALSPTMFALLAPEAPEQAARRARVRLEAAGAPPTT